jgi:predicted ATPase
MTPERRNRIEKLLQTARDLTAPQRAAFLDEACAGDGSLRREVESLLASHRSSFAESPPFDAETEIAISASSEEPGKGGELTGRQMGRYRFLALLGEGGMGQVYLALDTRLGRKVAIKVLLPELTKNEALLHRFEQEARAASALNHPNILTIYDIGEIESLHFIATEYVQGETLGHRLSNSKMTLQETLDIATQVTGALAEAHRAGIVHRDIKPANIMLRPDGNAKVIDFGLAKLVERHASSANYEVLRMTMVNTEPGIAMGTPIYMSPEQLRGSQLDEQTDIFSFGVMLYQMISGKLPFRGSTQSEVIAAILTDEPKPVSQYLPGVPSDLDQIVSKALQKTKEARYQEMKDLLFDLQALKRKLELGASSQNQTRRLEDTVRTPPPESHPDNLPIELTSFIGREAEIAAISKLLLQENTHLVTLTGTGGVGKTRLCLQVASHVAEQFIDGVHFVPLASINDFELISAAMAQTLGVRETVGYPLSTSLKEHLSGKHTLMVFDNFEQVIAGAPLLTELLTACPRLKVLVTSRALLHLRGECEFEVPPLELPDLKSQSLIEDLSTCPAVLLFTERARAVSPSFVVTNENARAVAEICVRLDGLPLALELAAARVRILSPQAILGRLGSRLDLLTRGPSDLPARQQTMRSTIAWSYELLSEREKKLFGQLAVFVGGFTLEAAESVCGEATEPGLGVLDGIFSLLANSLLRKQEADEPRFLMLETVREFALERLMAIGESRAVHRAHAVFLMGLVERAEPELRTSAQAAWLARLDREHDNIRAALRWTEESEEIELALRLAGAPLRFWEVRGYLSEGRAWLEELLMLARDSSASASVRAKALVGAGVLARDQSDYDRAVTLLEQGLALYRELEDDQAIASSLNILGLVARDRGDYSRAVTLLEEGLTRYTELADRKGIAFSLNYLGLVALDQGEYERAEALQEESVAISREFGDQQGIASSLNSLGVIALDHGNYERAAPRFAESLVLFRESGDKLGTATSLNNLGEVAQLQGDYERAAVLFEESLALFQEAGDKRNVRTLFNNLGDVARRQGDYKRATTLFAQTLALAPLISDKPGIAFCLEGLACIAFARNQPERAARLFGAAESLRDGIDNPLPPTRREEHFRNAAAVHTVLGNEVFWEAWSAGREMTLKETITCALE